MNTYSIFSVLIAIVLLSTISVLAINLEVESEAISNSSRGRMHDYLANMLGYSMGSRGLGCVKDAQHRNHQLSPKPPKGIT